MKKLIFSIILYACIYIQPIQAEEDIVAIRNLFYRATKSELANDSLINSLNKKNIESTPQIIGYKAMSKFMIALHAFNPYTKFKGFIEGKEMLDKVIETYPNNLELRFLRLTVQLNSPSFLMYKNNISEDKNFILKHAYQIEDSDLYNRLYNYSYTSKQLSKEEKQVFRDALTQNKIFNQISKN